jgi:hypothetical protein
MCFCCWFVAICEAHGILSALLACFGSCECWGLWVSLQTADCGVIGGAFSTQIVGGVWWSDVWGDW